MFVIYQLMWFEGAEKKFEIVAKGQNFLSRDISFWLTAVECAGAKVLSQIENTEMKAFLLSESSLFIWNDRVAMITCGRTALVRSAEFLIHEIGSEKIDLLTYERKNEFYPHQQETDFYKDVVFLQNMFKGKAYRFGAADEHHLFLFHGEKLFRPQEVDCTLEILMYNLKGAVREIFTDGQKLEALREITRMDDIFSGFVRDDYAFTPRGYSLNAIHGSEYYTLHVTPEKDSSYVSFETNVRLGNRTVTTLRRVLEIFCPDSFDVVYFHPAKELKAFDIGPYVQRTHVRQSLSCGYEVGFSTYYLRTVDFELAVPLGESP